MLSRLPWEPSRVSGVLVPPSPLFFLSRFLNKLSVDEKTLLPALLLDSGLLPAGDFSLELGRSLLLDLLRRLSAVSLSLLARLVRLELVVGES
jgi:hypothetical protein